MAVQVEGKGDIFDYYQRPGNEWVHFSIAVYITNGIQHVRPTDHLGTQYTVSVTGSGASVDGPKLQSQKIEAGEKHQGIGLLFSLASLTPEQHRTAHNHRGMIIDPQLEPDA